MSLLASGLIKRTIQESDLDTWINIKKHYLPRQYYNIYQIIQKHIQAFFKLPTFQQLTLEIRDKTTLEQVLAISKVQLQTQPFLLLQYLKNQFAQQQSLKKIRTFVQQQAAFQSAQQTIQSIYRMASQLQDRVDIKHSSQTMQKIQLFQSDQQVANFLQLGLNTQYDNKIRFRNTDYITIGGQRGQGKSVVCSNLAQRQIQRGKSVLYFSIQMPARQILQRNAAIATGIPVSKFKYKNFDNYQWQKVARYWASRYQDGFQIFQQVYMKNRDFNQFHRIVSARPMSSAQLQVIYQPNLTLSKFRAQAIRKCQKLENVGLVIVDYLNQIKKTDDVVQKFKWTDQIDISTAIKNSALALEVPHVSPYQIDSTGQARFAKGILDPVDYSYIIKKQAQSMYFQDTKSRGQQQVDFCSRVDWPTLTIGPQNGQMQKQQKQQQPRGKSFDLSDVVDI